MIKPLLIEIGVEELPAIPFLKELPNIEKKWADILEDSALMCEFDFFYTPRRLVLWHREFPLKQPDSFSEFIGAPVDVAFKEGRPTPAAIGFAKKCGVDIEALSRTEKKGKEVLYYKKAIEGQDAESLIGSMVDTFLHNLHFGKSMRWGSYEESFIRPIRWIGCMLGDKQIPFCVYGKASSSLSYPHRSVSFEPFVYDFAGDYFCKLDKNGVILYQDEREKKILKAFKEIENKHQVTIETDEALLAEIVAITEYPTVLMGRFDEKFLKLPPEVIITSMKEHQRYFPVFKDGSLTNNFIVVSNAHAEDFTQIIKGNEKVLKARLSDGLFFFENDLKNGLSFSGLKDITFMDGLGSIFDKEIREKDICCYLFKKYKSRLIDEVKQDEKHSHDLLIRTMMLSKADLLSEMVYEFTELQGLMGYYYAAAADENPFLALALKEQYLPNSEESALPSTNFSAVVALASKIDSLLALFSIGKIPTGTKDPFALRRAVVGIIKILLDRNFSFDLKRDLAALGKKYNGINLAKLEEFILERIYQFFDVNPSVVKAVLESGERDVLEIAKKINALKNIVQSSGFKEVFTTFKRVANIVKDVDIEEELSIDTALFDNDYEAALFEKFTSVNTAHYEDYERKLDALFGLKSAIDNFFDHVMVNVENEQVKTNRKNLVAVIYKAFKEVADIKEISV